MLKTRVGWKETFDVVDWLEERGRSSREAGIGMRIDDMEILGIKNIGLIEKIGWKESLELSSCFVWR